MNRAEVEAVINGSLKLVRTEYGLTQDKMALALGISKKSLVESEKGRRSLSWTECAALAGVFGQSRVLRNAFGGDPAEVLEAIAFDDLDVRYPATLGGYVWWRDIREENGYRVQQNMISQHYRLLNSENQRVVSSFDLSEINEYLNDLQKEEKDLQGKE